jgi:hypothetical protein
MTQWQAGHVPQQAMGVGPQAGHHGQQYSYNPFTGSGSWENAAGGFATSGVNPYGSGALSWIDPETGMQVLDFSKLSGLFGAGAGGGFNYNPYEMTSYGGGQIGVPDPYGGGSWGRPEDLSAAEVIESYRPQMENEIAQGTAGAGARLGASGFAMSQPYAKAVADVEQLARANMNQRTLEYGYDATKFDRNQELARQMAQNQEKYNAWQTHGGWQQGANLANAGNAMQQWMFENQLGFQGNQQENQFNFQNQQMNQQNINQMLAGLLGGMF